MVSFFVYYSYCYFFNILFPLEGVDKKGSEFETPTNATSPIAFALILCPTRSTPKARPFGHHLTYLWVSGGLGAMRGGWEGSKVLQYNGSRTTKTTGLRWWRTKTTRRKSVTKCLLLFVSHCHNDETRTMNIPTLGKNFEFFCRSIIIPCIIHTQNMYLLMKLDK
jgi:hypothetical protein